MIWERRADTVSALGMAAIAGWIACAATNHVKDLWSQHGQLVQVETKVVPTLQTKLKQDDCDKSRIAAVAGQAIASAQGTGVPSPGYSDIHGCSKVAPVKAPPLSKIVPKS